MQYLGEIISFIVGALAGGVSVTLYVNRNHQSVVNQNGNTVGGDMAGRDIKK